MVPPLWVPLALKGTKLSDLLYPLIIYEDFPTGFLNTYANPNYDSKGD